MWMFSLKKTKWLTVRLRTKWVRVQLQSIFFIIIWKYFLSNINLVFEYSVLDKTRLNCNLYFMGCQLE